MGTIAVGLFLLWGYSHKDWHDAEPSSYFNAARPRDEELEARRHALLRRIQAKQDIAAQVVARRLGLAEAVQRIRPLNLEDANSRVRILALHPRSGESAEERLCREVIAIVRGSLQDSPNAAQALLAHLEEETRRLLARQGLTTTSAERVDRKENSGL
jgi:hypothetical protein